MSAAHELAQRGFEVAVYERRSIPGGKARSVPGPRIGRANLPAEHGFRFFPGFYQHLPDTMKRIPYRNQVDGVFNNLVTATHLEMVRKGGATIIAPSHTPTSVDDVRLVLTDILRNVPGLSPQDIAHMAGLLLLLLCSCERRRYAEYDNLDWWTFSGAARRSRQYQQFLADGLTRSLVAAKAREMSVRTGGYIMLQLLLDMASPWGRVDRVLNGPTNDVWIDPWLAHLRGLGVDYRFNARVESFHCTGSRISAVTVVEQGVRHRVVADYYVSALPVEVMRHRATAAMKIAEPRLAGLPSLRTRWMNGVMFYLNRDFPMQRGHTIYIDSPWALTSISQQQFWPNTSLASLSDGRVRGILSVDISNWEARGSTGRTAMESTAKEIKAEVWKQLCAAVRDLRSVQLVDSFLDKDVVWPNGGYRAANLEPLLINTKGSWALRPDAVTAIENLFLASDYVRTTTDLATMEGANEAARRAVNGILDASGSREQRCRIWTFREPPCFAPLRAIDRILFALGLPQRNPASL
jgi:uncharacterized protein with NAD-binding domain and iron-sulfur cluster